MLFFDSLIVVFFMAEQVCAEAGSDGHQDSMVSRDEISSCCLLDFVVLFASLCVVFLLAGTDAL